MSRRLLSCLAVLVTLFPLGGAANAAASISPERLDDAVRLRSQLGFDARPSFVSALIAAGEVTDEGLVLTARERSEWANRAQVREAMEPALAIVDSAPTEFGDVYFDESTGDLVLHVNVLRTTSASARARVVSLLPAGANFEFHPVQFSRAELQAARDAVAPLVP